MEKIYNFQKNDIFSDWIFNNPNACDKKKVKEFNKWLKENQETYVELFHGTGSKVPVLSEGLKRTSAKTKKSLQSQTGFVYLSIYSSMAKTFGSLAYPYDKPFVYKIKIKIKDLKADLDQLNNKRYWSEDKSLGNSLAESIIAGSGVRVKRDICIYEIKLNKN